MPEDTSLPASSTSPWPWHEGERILQAHHGVADRMAAVGRRVIRDFMPDQHREFYSQLPFLLVGSVDGEGRPWASILEGEPGFAKSPDPRRLEIDRLPDAEDPALAGIFTGSSIGLLGIELHTRRRNRMNGRVSWRGEDGFAVAVEHAFGNCPQYIQLREIVSVAPAPSPRTQIAAGVDISPHLDETARTLIEAADTFFVASYADSPTNAGEPPHRSVDVSHRGGRPGFIRVDGDQLTIPDFAGNLHFNTLGNLLANPRAGLLFVDFETGDLLQLAGRTEMELEGPHVTAYQGAERIWRFHAEAVVRRPRVLRRRLRLREISPNSLMTGDWKQAKGRIDADTLRDAWRPFRIIRIEDESASIRSFYLEPADGSGIPFFRAGQHLSMRVRVPGASRDLIRTYSLSSAPSDSFFRFSVKRIGTVSGHLHDSLGVGDRLDVRAARGSFVVDPTAPRPLVLLAAGVGITPLLSMLREVIYEGTRLRRIRPTYLVQSAHSLAELPFRNELATLASRSGGSIRVVRLLSQPEPGSRTGFDFEAAGRIDVDVLKAVLPFGDFDFYLCGPPGFTQDLYDALRAHSIHDERIHAESFGPSTLRRTTGRADWITSGMNDTTDASSPTSTLESEPATSPVDVVFARSGTEARWSPESGTLLELAESRGLEPDFSCRGGTCGTCRTRLLQGEVCYPVAPADRPGPREVLICCAVPARSTASGTHLILDL